MFDFSRLLNLPECSHLAFCGQTVFVFSGVFSSVFRSFTWAATSDERLGSVEVGHVRPQTEAVAGALARIRPGSATLLSLDG